MSQPFVIPSPTPITGVVTPGGKPGMRRPIGDFQANYPFAFALYVQALLRWQQAGSQEADKSNDIGTSYFQVVGVHGVPYVPWQKDPTPAQPQPGKQPAAGYCTHRSVLFMPWHRPYLMLFEQILHTYATQIAGEASGYAAAAYKDALQDVRLPYWDWSFDPHLPPVVMSPTIDLTIPGPESGTTSTLHLAHNPLYSYVFTSQYVKDLIAKEMVWPMNDPAWAESKRCPEADGHSNQEVANVQVGTFYAFKTQTFQALTALTDFDQFTTQAWKSNLVPSAFTSVEVMHNNIHNYAGTNDTVIMDDPPKRQGSLTDVQASSFDPLFWLHHTHCDRLTALWQSLNPNCTIDEYPSLLDRYVAKTGTKESGKSNLEPWHKTAAHDMTDYWVADDTKELLSTFQGGYYYPETPVELIQDPVAMREHTIMQISALYGPPHLQPPSPPPSPQPSTPADSKQPLVGTPAPEPAPAPREHLFWQVFLRVRNFALTGTWAVHIFLGGPLPESSADWFLSEHRVGSVSLLSNSSRANCANCVAQAANNILVTGTVPLDMALADRNLDTGDVAAVTAYLKEHLHWRIVKDAQDVPITDEFELIVGVSAQTVSPAPSATETPVWGASTVYPEATAGKLGGLSTENRATMQV